MDQALAPIHQLMGPTSLWDTSCPPLNDAVTMHPLQSLAHVPDGLCHLLQGSVQGLVIRLQHGTNCLHNGLAEERKENTK